MSSSAIESQGVVIQWLDSVNSPNEYRAIPEVKSFSGPSGSAPVIDATDLGDTGKSKRMGLPDEGQLSLTINYIPDNEIHAGLRTARINRTAQSFRIIFTDTGTTQFNFSGFVTGFAVSGAVDGIIEATVTVEITGAVTES